MIDKTITDILNSKLTTSRLELSECSYSEDFDFGYWFITTPGNKECILYNLFQYDFMLRSLCRFVTYQNREEFTFHTKIVDCHIKFTLVPISNDIPIIVRDVDDQYFEHEEKHWLILNLKK